MISSLRRSIFAYSKLAELIFFPSFCELCTSLLDFPGEKVVCHTCLESIAPPRVSFCLCCGRFFDFLGEPHICTNCQKNPPHFSIHRSCGEYQGKLKDIILLYKYRTFKVLGRDLVSLVQRILGRDEELWWGIEATLPVPLHPKKHRQRGFNQAMIIAKGLSEQRGIECLEGVLAKIRNTPPQTSLVAEGRERNVRGTFRVLKKENISGKTLLLVDDVYTTGSTIRECSAVLKDAGAKEIRALTLAQA